VSSIDLGVVYIDDREKQALIFPDRTTKEKTLKFNLVKTSATGFIAKPVGQEFDTYDEVMKKYMRKLDRG